MTKRLRYILLLFIAIGYLAGLFEIGQWRFNFFGGDTHGYYLHVVSLFINQDVGDYDETISSLQELYPAYKDPREDKFGIRLTEKGRRYIKYTLGVGVMETPFFLLGHLYAKLSPTYAANGWSLPYYLAVSLSTIIYLLIGFNLLITVLSKYFSPRNVVLVVVAIAFATNLYYHGTYVTMAHGFLFFDYCLLLYLTVRFYDRPGLGYAIGIGTVVGLIAITRVPEVISALVPILWGVGSRAGFKERVQFFQNQYKLLFGAAVGFLFVFSLQMCYWHYVSGQLVFNPYEGEGFNFLQPKRILKGLFHFSNGWLIYTPIMSFSLLGLLIFFRSIEKIRLAILVFTGLHIYIHYSYYAWSYFPGFGSRPMVEAYPLLAFGLCAFFHYCDRRKWSWLPVVLVLGFGALNLFQMWQVTEGILYTERANKAFYLETFGDTAPSEGALKAYDSGECQPDPDKLTKVGVLVEEDFEDSTRWSATSVQRSGRFSYQQDESFGEWAYTDELRDIAPGDWLRIGVHAFMRHEDHVTDRDRCLQLVVELYTTAGQRRKWTSIKPSTQIGNSTHSIWHMGETGKWDEASFFVRIPSRARRDWKMKVFFWNPNGQRLYLDDFFIDHYRK